MSAAAKAKKAKSPTVLKALEGRFARRPFVHDASLRQPGPAFYSVASQPFAEAMAEWKARIRGERLFDVVQGSLHELTLDPRDGAIVRRAEGGLCYTPFAWSQLVSLMKTGAPMGLGNVMRWQSPLTRSHGWDDVVRASKRPRDEEAMLRCFHTNVDGRTVQAARAVVSGRYAKDFDDDRVLEAIGVLPERPVVASISRQWIVTHGSFVLDSDDDDVTMGFYLKNSEVGGASMEMTGQLVIRALDATVAMPSGAKYDKLIHIASDQASAKRRHTLPRYGKRGLLSEAERSEVAAGRISEDVERALEASRVLVARWREARRSVNSLLVPLCKGARAADGQLDESAVMILTDMLLELGLMPSVTTRDEVKAFAAEVAAVISDDARLRSIPHGSAAHMAATLAVVAQTGDRPWEEAVEIQRMSGRMLMEGWR